MARRTLDLTGAMQGRRLVRLRYHGREHLVEPHLLGDGRDGHQVLRAYRVAGDDGPGEGTGWRLFDLRDLDGYEVTETCFTPRPDYDPDDPAMAAVLCRV